MYCSVCRRPIIKRPHGWEHQPSDRPGVSNVFDHPARPATAIVEEERKEKEDRRRRNAQVHGFLNRRRQAERRREQHKPWSWTED